MNFPNYSYLNPHLLRLHETPFFPRISGKSQEFCRCFPISLGCQVSHHLAQDHRATRSVRGLHWLFCESPPVALKPPFGCFPFPQSPPHCDFSQPLPSCGCRSLHTHTLMSAPLNFYFLFLGPLSSRLVDGGNFPSPRRVVSPYDLLKEISLKC